MKLRLLKTNILIEPMPYQRSVSGLITPETAVPADMHQKYWRVMGAGIEAIKRGVVRGSVVSVKFCETKLDLPKGRLIIDVDNVLLVL